MQVSNAQLPCPDQFYDFDPCRVRKRLEEFSFEIAERILHAVNSLVRSNTLFEKYEYLV
jgi:hypothetical protein